MYQINYFHFLSSNIKRTIAKIERPIITFTTNLINMILSFNIPIPPFTILKCESLLII